MTVKHLIEELQQIPEDFEVKFVIADGRSEKGFINLRSFENITVSDIGFSDKIVILDGVET